MIPVATVAFLLAGVAAGALHVVAVARAGVGLGTLARLGGVAVLLVAAALLGHVVACAAGWAAAFFAGTFAVARHMRRAVAAERRTT